MLSTETILRNLASLIKYYRTENKFTQLYISQKLKVSLRTYQRIELGEVSPSLDVLINLSKILKFEFAEVFHYQSSISKEVQILTNLSKFLEQTTRMARVGGWDFDLIEKKLYWTQVTREIHEINDDTEINLDLAFSFYKEGYNRDTIQKSVQDCIQFGRPYQHELELMTAKGNLITIISNGTADFQDGKCVRIYGIFQDISKQKNSEKILKRALDELNEIQTFAGFGRWELNLQSNYLHWSSATYKLFEKDDQTFKATYEGFLELVHPEDREKVNHAYLDSLKTKLPYEVEHRILLKSGNIKWILERGHSVYDKDGAPIISTGYSLDITRFKMVENQSQILFESNRS